MKTIARALALLLLSTAIAGCAETEPTLPEKLPNHGKAPEWTLKDTDGRPVKSSDFAGKTIVLDFWATWCPPCLAEIPGYIELQKKYADKNLVIIGASLDEDGATLVKNFAKLRGINYTILMGDDATLAKFVPPNTDIGIPFTIYIDRQGNIRHTKMGALPRATQEKIIQKLLE